MALRQVRRHGPEGQKDVLIVCYPKMRSKEGTYDRESSLGWIHLYANRVVQSDFSIYFREEGAHTGGSAGASALPNITPPPPWGASPGPLLEVGLLGCQLGVLAMVGEGLPGGGPNRRVMGLHWSACLRGGRGPAEPSSVSPPLQGGDPHHLRDQQLPVFQHSCDPAPAGGARLHH